MLCFYAYDRKKHASKAGESVRLTVRLLGTDGGETAEALDIDGDFGLVVRMADGTVRTVRSGEVSVRGLYGYTE